ncbi:MULTISPECIES: hypothetical protein [Aeromonas]|uniref:hypothetical protein n=1 Tax=Aeromonas TaxID=642 RepID=UPI000E577A3C|nr:MULTISPECIES: hypothetical protein [Aeromonas]EHA1068038.1 hypothetical protein [Aeromonas hydrophila]MBM0438510.1 hypothetical protein [Aeromonas hydrophila subsp. ranae]MBW3829443.1 hypothetical protein [Aeromonas hydrophila]MCX4113681.1 hypothetical protein [Aeromonas hydrophila]MDD9230553.1 hypothetical protein [Aeromonas hydrophila]
MCSTIASSGDVLIDHDGLFPSPVIAASPDVFLGGKWVSRQDELLAPYDKSDNPLRPRSSSGRQRTLWCSGQFITVTDTAIGGVTGLGSGQAG